MVRVNQISMLSNLYVTKKIHTETINFKETLCKLNINIKKHLLFL